jgi:hypothetical protein
MTDAFDFGSHLTWLRCGIALVWLVFGLLFKALGLAPRHRQIVARVVGERRAAACLALVATGEIGIGIWMLSGHYLLLCVGLQTLVIALMNGLELRAARDLLLAPRAMVLANAALLTLGWYVAAAGYRGLR